MEIINTLKRRLADTKRLLSVSLFLSFTLCIYAPYELYLTNINEFWFSFFMFWWMPALVGAGVMFAVLFIGIILKNKAAYIYESLLFVLSICLYVQGNFLNLRVGVMNGAEIEWAQYKRHFIIDGIIIGSIIIVSGAFIIKKVTLSKKIITIFSLFLTAIQAVSLMVLIITGQGAIKDDSSKYVRVVTDKGLYEAGSDSNIIVFILDMFDDSYFKEILASEPEIKQELDGFTYFSNFTGSYSTTYYSLGHLFSGKYYYNEGRGWNEWRQQISNERMYLDEILDNGYELSVYSDFIECLAPRYIDASSNYIEVPFKINDKKHFMIDLYRLAATKYLPDFLKPYIWMTGTEFDAYKWIDSDHNVYSSENLIFKERLEDHGLSVEGADKQIKFIHITGAHYPYLIDENAQEVEPNSVSEVQCARGVLRIVEEYLEELRESGAYDKSNIILTADHGYYWDGVLTNPLFVVKPHDSSGELIINNAPVSQADFGPTVLDLVGLNADHNYGEAAFEIGVDSQRQRLFYQYYLEEFVSNDYRLRLIEYKIPPESNNPENFTLTDVEYTVSGEKIQHSKYCKTCKNGIPSEGEEYNPPRIVHEKDAGYPE